MSDIVAKYAQNALSYEQAKNQLIIGIGLTEEEAVKLLGLQK